MNSKEVLSKIVRLDEIIRQTGGYSYDTYDVRVGPIYQFLSQKRDKNTFFRLFIYLLYALELISPIKFRRLMGIQRTWDPMGNSYRAGFQMTLYQTDKQAWRLEEAKKILDDVVKQATGVPGKRGFALGFPCVTGSNKLWSTRVPVAHYSIRISRKFLIYNKLTGKSLFKPILDEVIRFLLDELPWTEKDGILGIAYTPEDPLQVINIWADAASLFSSYDYHYTSHICREKSIRLFKGVMEHQAKDGSWPYFAFWEGKPGKEDNSHTAMVLGALADVILCYPQEIHYHYRQAIEDGAKRWIDMFFDETSGKHWNTVDKKKHAFTVCMGDSLYAINRLVRPEAGLSTLTRQRLSMLADKIVEWSYRKLLLSNGHFCERKIHFFKYYTKSIRSFDGLSCDSLALYYAQKVLGTNYSLWTI